MIDITGSETLLFSIQAIAEVFYRQTHIPITLSGGGSGVGINMLVNQQTSIANSSRALEKSELEMAFRLHHEVLVSLPVARDIIVLAVHKDNPINNLSKEQVKKIYEGKVSLWSEVGGNNFPISLYGHQSSSGTYHFFQEKILDKQDFSSRVKEVSGDTQTIDSLMTDKASIAYISLSTAIKNLSKVKILSFEGKDPIKHLKTKTIEQYSLTRFVYQVLNASLLKRKNIQSWFRFIFSQQGDKLLKKTGLIPLNLEDKTKFIYQQPQIVAARLMFQ